MHLDVASVKPGNSLVAVINLENTEILDSVIFIFRGVGNNDIVITTVFPSASLIDFHWYDYILQRIIFILCVKKALSSHVSLYDHS